jgi:sugar (pentulose or hexulose) kinase
VTVGVHDSNSSLVPYLVKGEENFILNSTGTWCVVMHPSREYGFREDEIGKTVFYNISAREELVKTAIFMGGLEFQTYRDLILKASGSDEYPRYEHDTIREILEDCRDFIIPGIVRGAGQFPDSEPRLVSGERDYSLQDIQKGEIPPLFGNIQAAYGVLNLSLAMQTRAALDRIKAPAGSPIYVEGGFRKNRTYLTLLASFYPESPVYTTDISEATSFGAAMLGKAALEGKEPEAYSELVDIEMKRIEPDSFAGLEAYMERFLEFV